MVLKASTTPTEVEALTELLTSAKTKAMLSAVTERSPWPSASLAVTRRLFLSRALVLPKMVLLATTTFTPTPCAWTALLSCARMMADSVALMVTLPVASMLKPSTRALTSLRTSLRTTSPPNPESPPVLLAELELVSAPAASAAAAAMSTRLARSMASQRPVSVKSSSPRSKPLARPLNT